MAPRSTTLLGLVLCLGQTVRFQMGARPKPSISAEPGRTIPLGQNVTFVCRSPQSFSLFRLIKDSKIVIKDEKNTSPDQTEMRFPMGPVEASMAGRYSCVYLTSQVWSDHSEELELVVTAEEVTQASDPDPALPSVPTFPKHTVSNSIRLGLAGVVLLILAAILAEAWYSEPKSQ
ncbi:leukocyte-associated immunoglobulin-like receptor 2 isoform X2 [Ochotona curzoniae]|uniref:leukocyte-associated immunoglobulin-like receptor 2 isoform X2 n=1 Tax=Ochotona curzoniae TaxID=130825 RepID=UPI001B346C9E|nr:leukocyte-associated immunoglobulin-like receptor 2 isoform X2 [Ochotona curzoniae]